MTTQPQHDILDTERAAVRALAVSRLLLATLFFGASVLIRGEYSLFYLVVGVFFLATAVVLVRVRRPSLTRIRVISVSKWILPPYPVTAPAMASTIARVPFRMKVHEERCAWPP